MYSKLSADECAKRLCEALDGQSRWNPFDAFLSDTFAGELEQRSFRVAPAASRMNGYGAYAASFRGELTPEADGCRISGELGLSPAGRVWVIISLIIGLLIIVMFSTLNDGLTPGQMLFIGVAGAYASWRFDNDKKQVLKFVQDNLQATIMEPTGKL